MDNIYVVGQQNNMIQWCEKRFDSSDDKIQKRKQYREFMTKENNSNFSKEDYRSKNYSGDWTKAWLKKVDKSAIAEKKSIFQKMWELCDEKAEHMPKTLLKFYPFNQNSLKCIESNKVYLNSPDNFNDPYDCFICSEQETFAKAFFIEYINNSDYIQRGIITTDEFEKIKASYPDPPGTDIYGHYMKTFESIIRGILIHEDRGFQLDNIRYQAYKEYKKTISMIRNNKIKVTSFSDFDGDEFCRATEMWGHYAASHTGFCVEYDLKSKLLDLKLDSLIRGGMMPCRYSKKPVFIPSSLFWKYYSGSKMTINQKAQFDKAVFMSFLNKSSSWRYEKEWRLMIPGEVSEIYSNLIDFFPIITIYLGIKMPQNDKEYFYDFGKRKNINIVDMRCRDNEYELYGLSVDVDEYYDRKKFYLQSLINKSEYTFLQKI